MERLLFRKGLAARLRRLVSAKEGQFTLEAAWTLPIIVLLTFSLLWLAVMMYRESGLYFNAGRLAERTAYVWDNSRKDMVTGAVRPEAGDGLYWRLADDGLSQWFNVANPMSPVRVALPQSAGERDTAEGPAGKLARTAGLLDVSVRGSLSFQHYGLFRVVRAALERNIEVPATASRWFKSTEIEAFAASYVVEPVETIRLTDLTRTFISEIQGRIKPKQALAAMVQPASDVKQPVPVTSHAQAAEYVRLLVNGTETIVQATPESKRTIDALDASGVAHQAYYTFNEKNLREVQMTKDLELLKKGVQVKGVVWHFFKTSNQDKIKLSQGLRKELERSGIVVVFHE